MEKYSNEHFNLHLGVALITIITWSIAVCDIGSVTSEVFENNTNLTFLYKIGIDGF